jgi:hypothetical protein
MMKIRHVVSLVLAVFALAALAACSDAIYSKIETATQTPTNTLPHTISVFDIAVTAAAPATYYVAAGTIFQWTLRADGTYSWQPNAADSSVSWKPAGLLCNAMTFYNGAYLVGGFIAQDGTPSLYKSSAPPYSFSTGTTLATASAGEQVTMLAATGTNLFVGGATMSGSNYVYQLEYSATGAPPWTVLLSSQSNPFIVYPFVGVAWDGTNYWTASGPLLFQSPTVPTSFTSNTSQSWGTINGVYATVSGAVFVATKSNGIFYSTNSGGTWSHINPDVVGTATVSYLAVAGPFDTANTMYLVGSDGYGYYTLTIGGGLSRFGDSTVGLYSGSVSRIALDTTNNVVLMGTNSKGLWRTVYDPGDPFAVPTPRPAAVPASGQSWTNE